jgi:hypothetical protein
MQFLPGQKGTSLRRIAILARRHSPAGASQVSISPAEIALFLFKMRQCKRKTASSCGFFD